MDILDLDDKIAAQALKTAMLDAGIGWLDSPDDDEPLEVMVDGDLDLVLVVKHFKRILTAAPIIPAEPSETPDAEAVS